MGHIWVDLLTMGDASHCSSSSIGTMMMFGVCGLVCLSASTK